MRWYLHLRYFRTPPDNVLHVLSAHVVIVPTHCANSTSKYYSHGSCYIDTRPYRGLLMSISSQSHAPIKHYDHSSLPGISRSCPSQMILLDYTLPSSGTVARDLRNLLYIRVWKKDSVLHEGYGYVYYMRQPSSNMLVDAIDSLPSATCSSLSDSRNHISGESTANLSVVNRKPRLLIRLQY